MSRLSNNNQQFYVQLQSIHIILKHIHSRTINNFENNLKYWHIRFILYNHIYYLLIGRTIEYLKYTL